MKKILIDTNSINGRRSALIEGDKLIDFDLEFEVNLLVYNFELLISGFICETACKSSKPFFSVTFITAK